MEINMSKPTYKELKKQVKNLQQQINVLTEKNKELEKLENIINNSPAVGIRWVFGEGWPATYISQSVSQWGYNPEDFISKKIVFDDAAAKVFNVFFSLGTSSPGIVQQFGIGYFFSSPLSWKSSGQVK